MNTYDFIHLALHAMGDEIKGKTKLQKTAYFLGIMTQTVSELGFQPHYYGPYSAEVAGAADRLRALGFANQSVSSGGAVDPFGFEVARYDLRLTEEGKRMAQAKAEKNPQEWEKIRKAAEALKRVGEQDYIKLSIAAKAYFMLGQRQETTKLADLVPLAGQFGWSVSPDQVSQAAQFLESLGLIKLARSSE